jgi:hypothetical protein
MLLNNGLTKHWFFFLPFKAMFGELAGVITSYRALAFTTPCQVFVR